MTTEPENTDNKDEIANDPPVEEKKEKLLKWIKQEKDNTDFALHGVVLAPLATGASMIDGRVQVVCGDKAQKKLGGLKQVFRWLNLMGLLTNKQNNTHNRQK